MLRLSIQILLFSIFFFQNIIPVSIPFQIDQKSKSQWKAQELWNSLQRWNTTSSTFMLLFFSNPAQSGMGKKWEQCSLNGQLLPWLWVPAAKCWLLEKVACPCCCFKRGEVLWEWTDWAWGTVLGLAGTSSQLSCGETSCPWARQCSLQLGKKPQMATFSKILFMCKAIILA